MKDELSADINGGGEDGLNPRLPGEITLFENGFYMLMHYFPQAEPNTAIRPVITLLTFNSPHDAFMNLLALLPDYVKQEKTGLLSDLLLKASETKAASDIKNAVDCYNSVFGLNNARMPAIDRAGSPADIMSSEILLGVMGNKRVRIKHPVLKALMDIKKFDEKNQRHLRMAEKFLNQILR